MNSDPDFFEDEEERRRAAILKRARVEGIEVAYEAALAICRDPKAAGQAKAAAGRTLLQIGGMLDRADRQSAVERSPDEMSAAELDAEVRRLRRQMLQRQAAGDTVFD